VKRGVLKQFDQADLSAKIDIATRTVQRWEKGDQVAGQ